MTSERNAESVRLYGLEGDEHLFFDPAEVVERWIEDNDGCTEAFEIEEWSVHPPQYHMPHAVEILGWIGEWTCENGDIGDDMDLPIKDVEVVAAAKALLDLIASKVTWRMADELVATHTLTWDAENEPLLDGQPLYRKAAFERHLMEKHGVTREQIEVQP